MSLTLTEDVTARCDTPLDTGVVLYVGRDPMRDRFVVTAVGQLDPIGHRRLIGLLDYLHAHETREWVELDVAGLTISTGAGLAELGRYQQRFAAVGGCLTVTGAGDAQRTLLAAAGVALARLHPCGTHPQ